MQHLKVIVFVFIFLWIHAICSAQLIPDVIKKVTSVIPFEEEEVEEEGNYDDEIIPSPDDIEIGDRHGDCDKDLGDPRGLARFIDFPFLTKLFLNLSPLPRPKVRMSFFLFKKDFPECGKEIRMDDNSLMESGLNPAHQTRIIIHGWMSQGKTAFNRDVKKAYLNVDDFNVIVVDWSLVASNINYFSVVRLIDSFGMHVAKFVKHLNKEMGVKFDDIYLIGHSLGAQIAGSAGKHIKPNQFNTIFALDPAGPKFRKKSDEFRIDPTDAKYVESIQTSVNLGFIKPTGNATFYPNYGRFQKCLSFGCSHVRAHQYFAESITSPVGFWGTRCNELGKYRSLVNLKLDCNKTDTSEQFVMGGEPATRKIGVFYVDTNADSPYAKGKNKN